MTRTSSKLPACLLPLLIALPAIGQDDEEAFDRTPRDCITSSSIRQTEAVDDQNVLFFMRDRTVYRNHLPRSVPVWSARIASPTNSRARGASAVSTPSPFWKTASSAVVD